MPKMKTHKGIQRRVRLSAGGKVRYKKSFAGHLMSRKSGNRVRRARQPAFITGAVAAKVRRALGA